MPHWQSDAARRGARAPTCRRGRSASATDGSRVHDRPVPVHGDERREKLVADDAPRANATTGSTRSGAVRPAPARGPRAARRGGGLVARWCGARGRGGRRGLGRLRRLAKRLHHDRPRPAGQGHGPARSVSERPVGFSPPRQHAGEKLRRQPQADAPGGAGRLARRLDAGPATCTCHRAVGQGRAGRGGRRSRRGPGRAARSRPRSTTPRTAARRPSGAPRTSAARPGRERQIREQRPRLGRLAEPARGRPPPRGRGGDRPRRARTLRPGGGRRDLRAGPGRRRRRAARGLRLPVDGARDRRRRRAGGARGPARHPVPRGPRLRARALRVLQGRPGPGRAGRPRSAVARRAAAACRIPRS
jgi:hypothetical protein